MFCSFNCGSVNIKSVVLCTLVAGRNNLGLDWILFQYTNADKVRHSELWFRSSLIAVSWILLPFGFFLHMLDVLQYLDITVCLYTSCYLVYGTLVVGVLENVTWIFMFCVRIWSAVSFWWYGIDFLLLSALFCF